MAGGQAGEECRREDGQHDSAGAMNVVQGSGQEIDAVDPGKGGRKEEAEGTDDSVETLDRSVLTGLPTSTSPLYTGHSSAPPL
jgi:hypothetical protein